MLRSASPAALTSAVSSLPLYPPPFITGDELCRAFRNTGHCRYGEECKFLHEEGKPIAPPNKPVGEVRRCTCRRNSARPGTRD